MKKILLICLFALLAGCKTVVPVDPPRIPDLPPVLATKAEKLPPITDNSMGTTVLDGVETDKKYNGVAFQLNTLIDVYNCVKETLNEKKDPKECLSPKQD